jgi:cytochrome c oxidase cbb3-type subunit 2
MSLRTFILGLAISFGIAWLAVVVIPFNRMRTMPPVEFNEAVDGKTGAFYPKRTGRIADGARVYAENGCYQCHSQLIRPTYAGNDMFRPDWAGNAADPDRGDTRRESNAWDYAGESFAQIGQARIGPDLSNVGLRLQTAEASKANPEAYLFQRLYNPRSIPELWQSTCPPHPFLFKTVHAKGAKPADAVSFDAEKGQAKVPNDDARALASYLLSLRKDHAVPASLNFAPAKPDAAN